MTKCNQAIIALDLGSTFCGYAYYIDNPNDAKRTIDISDIKVNKPWRPLGGHDHLKTPTALLLDGQGDVLDFGFGAIQQASKQVGAHTYQVADVTLRTSLFIWTLL